MSMYGSNNSKSTPTGKSLTKQSFTDECDINKIMAKYQKTGTLTHINNRPPRYEDVSQIGDFREAQEKVAIGKSMFAILDAQTRERFGNDPANFFEFASDPENERQVLEMGFGKEIIDRMVKDHMKQEATTVTVPNPDQLELPNDRVLGTETVPRVVEPEKSPQKGSKAQ